MVQAPVVRKTVPPPPKPGRYAPTWDALIAQVQDAAETDLSAYQAGEIAKALPEGRAAWAHYVAQQRARR